VNLEALKSGYKDVALNGSMWQCLTSSL